MTNYPLPNATNVVTFMNYPNDVTSGWFWTICLVAIFAIVFGNLKINNETVDSFASSSFFTGVIGMLFGILQWVNNYVTLISIIMAVIGAMTLLWKKKPD